MSRVGFAVIPLFMIILLSAFFFFSPKFLGQKPINTSETINEIINKKFTSLGKTIAHMTFVEDAFLEENVEFLSEVIRRLKKTEPELDIIHFTDKADKIIASSDSNYIGKVYNSTLILSGTGMVREKSGVYEGGFTVNVGTTRIGALYFQARPKIPEIKISNSPQPIVLIVGVVIALITFLITLSMSKGMESSLIEDINKRQEDVFLPKIEALKTEQTRAQKNLDEINRKISDAHEIYQKLNDECMAKREEYESSPLVQSVEKLKQSEEELLKRLQILKEEESKLSKDVSLLIQKKEEITNALEAAKKEESSLREKLDLIKKKILHLETPSK